MSAKRVLLLADQLGNGGAERQLALTARHLPDDWERLVWAFEEGSYVGVLAAAGVPVDAGRRAWRYDGRRLGRLWPFVRSFRPAVVHSWGWNCSAVVGPWCRATGVPLVDGTIRNANPHTYRRWGRRAGMLFADLVVANSRAGLEAWGVGSSRGRVIRNGFDPDRYGLCGPNRPRRPDDGRLRVVMVARMSPEKDYATLLSVAHRLWRADREGWRFLAVGDGPLRERLSGTCDALVRAGVVEFIDGGLEPLDVVADADVGVLMTGARESEGISNAIMEYMAAGLPVVCSAGGGNAELVTEGVTGITVPVEDGVALAEALIYLKENPAERRRLGAAGAQRLRDEYSLTRMIDATVAVYREAIARHDGRPEP